MALKEGTARSIKASFVLFGTIVGAGIFGLPYVVEESGYFVGLTWMVVLAGAVTLTHLLYGEVVMATEGDHRLVGYVTKYLGAWAGRVETVASFLGLFSASLAYLILGGLFVQGLASAFGASVAAPVGAGILFVFGLAAAWFGTRFLSGVDFWLTLVEFGAIALLAVVALTGFEAAHLAEVDLTRAFLPYGVVLFAYGGLAAINETRAIAGGDPARVRRSIVAGTLLAAALTILFVTAVVGALGPSVTPESVGGLNARFGGSLPVLAAVAGLFSILTSYVVFGEFLKSTLQKDFGRSKIAAVAIAIGGPFALYLAGVRSFGRVIELSGAALLGIEGALVCFTYLAARKRFPGKMLAIPKGLVYLLAGVYLAGAFYEVVIRTLLGRG